MAKTRIKDAYQTPEFLRAIAGSGFVLSSPRQLPDHMTEYEIQGPGINEPDADYTLWAYHVGRSLHIGVGKVEQKTESIWH